MNWYRENRWLGNFLVAFAVGVLIALWFLLQARNRFVEASAEFNQVAAECARLENLNPFPNEENFRKTQLALENYRAQLNKIKEDLKTQVVPQTPLAPNEFQSRLRQSILSVTEKARANRVKLPDNFCLGFDEFATRLPDTGASTRLGQELGQIEFLLNILFDNRVDTITSLKRSTPFPELAPGAVARKSPNAVTPVVERAATNLTFTASPSALRKVLNQIATSDRQFFIVRTLHVRNEQQKGPPRGESGPDKTAGSAETTNASSGGTIKFIVGNEHVEASARIELIRFAF